MQEKYLEQKSENDKQYEDERQELKDVHEMLHTLYLVKHIKSERIKSEPIPDKPGYFLTTKRHIPFEWPAEFGPRPELNLRLPGEGEDQDLDSERKSKSAV